ncbi:GNAT family N-acetyltransferase [Streptomyces sp. NPDC059070]|uniref:GNAT family N-acetyltransferase n=1 Tax=Streptomyces sp. NPDC059070 TaxID=3346713 RepID=UPI0036D10134
MTDATAGDHARIPVLLTPWSVEDLTLLHHSNSPAMTSHTGGPETEEALLKRQHRYEALSARPAEEGRMFRVSLEDSGEPVGSVGYWPRTWQGEEVYETGYGILPEFQGRGLGVAALRAVARAAAEAGGRRKLHAYPSVDNAASNAVLQKAGFELLGKVEFEYPPGHEIVSHDWCLDLHPVAGAADPAE